MMKNKVLILVPPLDILGGVALHYKGLQKHWNKNVSYFEVFRSINHTLFSPILYLLNIIKYVLVIIFKRPKLLVVNVSLKKGFFSKNIYIIIAKKVFGLKIITFIHGWDRNCENMLNEKKSSWILSKSNAIIVLANEFKNKLIAKGVKTPVYLSSTKVDEELIKGYDNSKRDGTVQKLLFVSRIEEEKGIFISLRTFKLLLKDDPNLSFDIVGEGEALEEVKQFIEKEKINNVNLKGRLHGAQLANAFKTADFFIFPTFYGEGMPAALLESLAFGLPVAIRPEGGIPDFFINGEMGILTESKDPYVFYEKIKSLINDNKRMKHISQVNYEYAQRHFMASAVTRKMESIFNEVISRN